MCHQTVSLIARHLEAEGIATVCLASALDIIEAGRPPRAVFVDYPLGHTTGRPFESADQRAVVNAALDAFAGITTPGEVRTLDVTWAGGPAWRADAVDPSRGDTRQLRDTTPRYQSEDDRRLAEARLGESRHGRNP